MNMNMNMTRMTTVPGVRPTRAQRMHARAVASYEAYEAYEDQHTPRLFGLPVRELEPRRGGTGGRCSCVGCFLRRAEFRDMLDVPRVRLKGRNYDMDLYIDGARGHSSANSTTLK